MFYPSSSVKIENLFRVTACFHKEGSFQQGILLVYAYVLYTRYKNVLKYSNARHCLWFSNEAATFSSVAWGQNLSCLCCYIH